MLIITPALGELDVEWGISKASGDEGYLTVIETKLLQLVSEALCLVPTDSVNYCYLDRLTSGASTVQCKPTKKGDVASPMIKSGKIRRG